MIHVKKNDCYPGKTASLIVWACEREQRVAWLRMCRGMWCSDGGIRTKQLFLYVHTTLLL